MVTASPVRWASAMSMNSRMNSPATSARRATLGSSFQRTENAVQTSRDQSSAVSRYIAYVRQIPELSREQEADLARAWRDRSDQNAAARLALANLRHVVSIAVSYRRYGIPLADLIAEGNFGIVHAIRKYDPDRGNRFVTYAAYWIRAYILNHVIHSWSLVGVGSGP